MPQQNFHENGVPQASRLLLELRTLPCPQLQTTVQRMSNADTLKMDQMLEALSLLVQVVQNERTRHLGFMGTILFYGPTGSGKSTLATLLPQIWANASGSEAVLTRINSHALASSEHGTSQKNVVRLFDALGTLCAEGKPVFAVIDELENLATDRNEISGKTSPIDARNSVNAFMEQVDHKPANCFLLTTTNVESLLDDAVRNRFDLTFLIPAPSGRRRLNALRAVVSAFNPDSPLLEDLPKEELEQLDKATAGLSFRALRALVFWCVLLHKQDVTLNVRQLVTAAKSFRKNSPLT